MVLINFCVAFTFTNKLCYLCNIYHDTVFCAALLLQFGAMATPFNSIMNETVCFSYTAIDDDVKEDNEQLTIRLESNDSAVCLCLNFGIISVYEDGSDGMSCMQGWRKSNND